jgi:hopanoid-associated phosphorylase
MTLGIICGFKAEETLARRLSSLTACAWRNPAAPRSLIDRGATALLSFGLAGGLAPGLAAGQVLIPGSVLTAEGAYDVDAALHARLLAAIPNGITGPLYAADAVIATPAAKRTLHEKTGAMAVDMESGLVAAAAQAAGIPFAVLRAVSDAYDHALPQAALVALDDDGELALWPLLGALLRQPAQLPQLLRTGRESKKAMQALAACIKALDYSAT